MNKPLHAAHYADRGLCETVAVLANEPIARDTYRLRFSAPEMASRFLPGQFLMLRLADCDDPLIGRPLALYDCVMNEAGDPAAIDVVYLVARLAKNSASGVLWETDSLRASATNSSW